MKKLEIKMEPAGRNRNGRLEHAPNVHDWYLPHAHVSCFPHYYIEGVVYRVETADNWQERIMIDGVMYYKYPACLAAATRNSCGCEGHSCVNRWVLEPPSETPVAERRDERIRLLRQQLKEVDNNEIFTFSRAQHDRAMYLLEQIERASQMLW